MILVTGGAGYIGSHTVCELLNRDIEILVIDNFSNSSPIVFDRIEQITGKKTPYIEGDIRDTDLLNKIFKQYPITAVIHFAGLKSVNESMRMPLEYLDVNLTGTLQVLKAMQQANVNQFVFSSSATVYGERSEAELSESMPMQHPSSHYGLSKMMVEQALDAISQSHPDLSIAVLRYFNPIGAHQSGLIGENPRDIPNNLLPYVTQVAVGILPILNIYGKDYPTPDGTAIRDYIHVQDLAQGHLAALNFLKNNNGIHRWNLGTGKGSSVLEVVQQFEQVNQVKLNYEFQDRREGDVIACWANTQKAEQELKWQAKHNLTTMLKDAWRWQKHSSNKF